MWKIYLFCSRSMNSKEKVISVLSIVLFFLLVLFLKLFIIDLFNIPSISMENTLLPNDKIIVCKLYNSVSFRFIEKIVTPHYHGVIVFKNPITKELYVKRCIGHSGDSIRIIKEKVFINGQLIENPLTGKPTNPNFQYGINILRRDSIQTSFYVPYKHYLMLGDNRNNSYDSRHFGPIPEENIIGKAVLVLFNYHNGKFRWDRFFKKIK